ncbi:MAG: family 43 glycosylhydrolase, partial [Spirochaetales bacterium]|nr:family 43 glycosylhydrolase [Spirochaetales bacterium]
RGTMNTNFIKRNKPILECQGDGFESKSVYNPTAIVEDDTVYILYRTENGEDGCTGRIGLAWSKDGINFKRHPEPVLYPEYDYEKMGCEDPRIVKFGNTYYLFYMANGDSSGGIQIALASSKDLLHWEKLGLIKMNLRIWDREKIKAAVVCPEKTNGKYVMYFLGQRRAWHAAIGVAFSDDLIHWEEYANNPVVIPRIDNFDCLGVEPGATPIVENGKIILIYNGWDENKVHKTGYLVFTKDNPVQVLERCEEPIIEPTEEWEIEGPVRNVTFAEGVIRFNSKWLLYYGAADKCIGLAEALVR